MKEREEQRRDEREQDKEGGDANARRPAAPAAATEVARDRSGTQLDDELVEPRLRPERPRQSEPTRGLRERDPEPARLLVSGDPNRAAPRARVTPPAFTPSAHQPPRNDDLEHGPE